MTPLRWFTLGTIIGLVMVLALIFAATAQAHDWYSGKRNPITNNSCCNSSHCKVLDADQWSITSEGFTVRWDDGRTYSMPLQHVQPTEDKQGRAVACVWGGMMKCGFMPFGS